MLSISGLRRWVFSHTSRGQGSGLAHKNKEVATYALSRTIGIDNRNFFQWLHGKRVLSVNQQRLLSAFVQKWEAGQVAFTESKSGKERREIVHLDKPRPRRTRMRVDLSGGAARVQLVQRPQVAPSMPTFRQLIRPRT